MSSDSAPAPHSPAQVGPESAAAVACTRLLDELTDPVTDPLCLLSPAGEVAFVNRAALNVLGYAEAAALVGEDAHTRLHAKGPDGRPCADPACPLRQPPTGEEVVRTDRDWFVRRDGSMVPVSYTLAPLPTTRGVGATLSFRDIRE